ncbi:DUF1285 domain-containing protein [Kordiimonas sp. SCSIO 12610]|uniref:DUF1285 domain-containing protein n=1 Tax=Kordiimonas sp. SCSIO 12610 TaxID=2829597 RepID=UPI00210DF91C|nr:DUF1285 domain-containing protein [Kordiimonas sp. SCSIO 12610]UTW54459.1 DUF1285 domain-containing protein [Kordiimonas sp. SCSIO 12610]
MTNTKSNLRLEEIVKQIGKQSFPPVERWNPDFCGDIDMRIAVDGTWYYMGTPIGREKMVRLFASVLRKDEDGKTYLVTPVEKIGITVDDAPFVATELNVVEEDDGRYLHFKTNVGDEVIAGPEHPLWVVENNLNGEPRPYIRIRGRLDALISRSVFYQLASMAELHDNTDAGKSFVVETANGLYHLGNAEEFEGQ